MEENDVNPYATPSANVLDPEGETRELETKRVRTGQKLAIYAILVQILGGAGQIAIHPALASLFLVALVMSVIGVGILGRYLYGAIGYSVLLVILMFVPFVNLFTLLVVNAKATKCLRAAGYKVGLLGAGKRVGT